MAPTPNPNLLKTTEAQFKAFKQTRKLVKNTDTKGYSTPAMDKIAGFIYTLSSPVRVAIMKALEETEEMSVLELQFHLNMEQSITSQHLALLRELQLVTRRTEGKCAYYSLNKPLIADFKTACDNLIKHLERDYPLSIKQA